MGVKIPVAEAGHSEERGEMKTIKKYLAQLSCAIAGHKWTNWGKNDRDIWSRFCFRCGIEEWTWPDIHAD